MAIVVEHIESREQFVVVGAGFGMFKTARPGFFGGNLFPNENEGTQSLIAVANVSGEIRWFDSRELRVLEVDGAALRGILESAGEQEGDSPSSVRCPACASDVGADASRCPSCGLRVGGD